MNELASKIQHTNINNQALQSEIEQLIEEALRYKFQSVVVLPIWAPFAVERLRGSGINVCSAIDFPHSVSTIETVGFSTKEMKEAGVDELDIVTKVGWLKNRMYDEYKEHLRTFVRLADGIITKAIIEYDLLTAEELEIAIDLCAEAGLDFIKNSTGFGGGQATPEKITCLKELSNGRLKIKASSGIRDYETAKAIIAAGADVFAASASVAIMRELEASLA